MLRDLGVLYAPTGQEARASLCVPMLPLYCMRSCATPLALDDALSYPGRVMSVARWEAKCGAPSAGPAIEMAVERGDEMLDHPGTNECAAKTSQQSDLTHRSCLMRLELLTNFLPWSPVRPGHTADAETTWKTG